MTPWQPMMIDWCFGASGRMLAADFRRPGSLVSSHGNGSDKNLQFRNKPGGRLKLLDRKRARMARMSVADARQPRALSRKSRHAS